MKRIFIFLTLLLGGLAGNAQTQLRTETSTFSGFDSFGNEMIVLTLLADGTYVYSEKFLDGSSLTDSGKWQVENGVLILRSATKVVRKHNYQTYKKAYKFKSVSFELTEEGFTPLRKSLSNDNAYLMTYSFRKRKE